MPEATTTVRRSPKRAGTRPFAYDRHGDLVESLDDNCGATVIEADFVSRRWLAAPPLARRA